jgi:hypothetical protein
MSVQMKEFFPRLKRFKRANASTRQKMIQSCDKHTIDCFCECVMNAIKGNVPLKRNQSECLRRHKRILYKLLLKKTPVKLKKKILQTGGFLGALIAPVLSFLASKLFG